MEVRANFAPNGADIRLPKVSKVKQESDERQTALDTARETCDVS